MKIESPKKDDPEQLGWADSAIFTVTNSLNSIVQGALEESSQNPPFSEFLAAKFTFCLGARRWKPTGVCSFTEALL